MHAREHGLELGSLKYPERRLKQISNLQERKTLIEGIRIADAQRPWKKPPGRVSSEQASVG
jgi:hypothetical protein